MTALYETAMKDLAEITGLVKTAHGIIAEQNRAIAVMRAALLECASRCQYDGDLFYDQGIEARCEASWQAASTARAALALCEGKQS